MENLDNPCFWVNSSEMGLAGLLSSYDFKFEEFKIHINEGFSPEFKGYIIKSKNGFLYTIFDGSSLQLTLSKQKATRIISRENVCRIIAFISYEDYKSKYGDGITICSVNNSQVYSIVIEDANWENKF